jgi:sugar transferase (PEP-CTERM/EpsH1 system associated)
MPLSVSVIIPTYNPAATLREAIDSALAQTQPPREVIVVDDGSTQDTSWVPAAYGGRIRFVRQSNGGPASARNAGCRLAAGECLAFLDADDVWEPEKLAMQSAALAASPRAGLVYSPAARIDRAGRPVPAPGPEPLRPSGRIAEALFEQNVIPTSTVMIRRACLEAVGWFDEDPRLISVEDYDLWLRIAERFEVLGIERPLVRYRVHPAGISRNTDRSYGGERLVLEKAVARRAGTAPVPPGRWRRRLAQLYFEWGHEHFHADRLREARGKLWTAWRLQPSRLDRLGFAAAACLGRGLIGRVRALRRPAPEGPRRRRIAHVLFSLETGGAEHVALDVLRRLPPQDYDRHVIGLTGPGPLAEEFRRAGITVHVLRKREGVDVPLWLALTALLRRERFDIVHTHNVTPWFYAGPAAALAGARLVHTEHSNLLPAQRRLMAAERWLARLTRWVIADSEEVRRGLVRQGVPAGALRTVHNGIDTARFAAPAPSAARTALSLNGAEPVVGIVARLVEIKDFPTLFEAFRTVLRTVPRAVLLVVGDGPLRSALEAEAARLGIAGQIQFLGRRTDIPDIVAALDLFVLCSLSEGLPLTVLEAMAAGVPVVATDVGALREAVQEGRTGLLVPPRSPARLAEAIIALLRDPARRRAMGEEAARLTRARFDLAQMVAGYEAAYRD